jgi:N-acetylglucosaminyldiphosphoundecaprenol N-acetyl-beta-D-mannosaminyltransferase
MDSAVPVLHPLGDTKRNIVGVRVNAMPCDTAIEAIIASATARRPMAVSALAVHGVMTGVLDDCHRYRLNQLDLVLPDGQPVRWVLNGLHRAALPDRVYGPTLMLRLCERAAADRLPIYLYGSRPSVLDRLVANLVTRFPGLEIAGRRPSSFRRVDAEEKQRIAEEIRRSGAAITFVGLGCPRQETWVYEMRSLLPMPLIAVGAAFDFHAGTLRQAPPWIQGAGLEWLFRLALEPRRLWRRYILLNPLYVTMVALQAVGVRSFDSPGVPPAHEQRYA